MRPIVCVLKNGVWSYHTQHGKPRNVRYTADHVRRLQRQAKKHAPNSEFLCLSNTRIDGVQTIPLQQHWPGWWAKMELFRLNFPLLYLDLDVAITGPLQPLLEAPHTFTACSPLSEGNVAELNSSVMAWDRTPRFLFDAFMERPNRYMAEFQGDQDFIAERMHDWQTWDEHFPNAVVAYKQLEGDPGPETRIVVFNGKPKPEEVEHPWMP